MLKNDVLNALRDLRKDERMVAIDTFTKHSCSFLISIMGYLHG